MPLVGLTIACLRLPCFSVSLLQVLAGSWVSVLAFRRRCLSILDHIYVLQRGRDRKDLVGTTPELRAELFCLCVLAPQLVADMRAQSSNYLVATDASDDRGAAVGTSLPGCWGRELQRHTLVKGLWNRLLKPSEEMLRRAGQLRHDDELPGESYRTHALWTLLARGLHFHSIADFAREPRVHINVKELQSYLITEEFLSTSVWEGARFVSMLDSQVVLGSLVKGRSSSPSLNRALQGSVPAYLFFGLHPAYAFVASGDNPSDDGTRGRPLRGPSVELPAWFDAGATGDFKPFDLFLGRLGLLPEQLQGLPELFERFTSRSGLPLPPAGARRVFSRCHSEDRSEETFSSRPEVPSAEPGAPASNPVGYPTAQPLPIAARAFFASCAAGQFVWPGAGRPKASVRPDVPVYLCLFSGARGVAKAVVRTLQVPALTFDWADSPSQDLSQLELQQALLEAARCGAFLGVGISPPWATFSAASMPRVRSRSHPCGLECLGASDAQKVAKDNALASFVADFSLLLWNFGVPFWIDGPDSSLAWLHPRVLAVAESLPGNPFWTFDRCRFNEPWQKRTRLLTTLDLAGGRECCLGGHSHLNLRGRSARFGASWTRVAESFPRGVCQRIADSLARFVARHQASVSEVVRENHKRIGEAGSPGPTRRRVAREGSLFDIELIEPKTVQLRERIWDVFMQWLRSSLTKQAIAGLFKCPPLLALTLRDYGDELFREGFPRGSYRQLLAHVQKIFPLIKPHMHVAWTMVSRWELLQPVSHRTPMPEPLLHAMAGLGLSLGWVRWTAALLAIFYFISRPGEVLCASRKDVLTPEDALDRRCTWLYLKIPRPKSRKRAARVQHVKLNDPTVLGFVCTVWQHLRRGEKLYPGSPASFRRRWDRVLQILQVPPTAQLTPASLRAGGAIAAFHQGVSIPDLLWRMRLRSQVTLEFYLQEMAGASVLPSLAARVRQRIQAGQCFYAAIERRAIHWYERAKRPEGGVEAVHPESRAAAKGSSQNLGCPASKRA